MQPKIIFCYTRVTEKCMNMAIGYIRLSIRFCPQITYSVDLNP